MPASSSAFPATYSTSGVGEPEGTSTALVVGLDEALVLELGDRRVDRAGLGFQAPRSARRSPR